MNKTIALLAAAGACITLPQFLPRLLPEKQVEAQIASISLAKLATMSELTTKVADVDVVVRVERLGSIPGTQTTLVYKAKGRVRAGVDLAKAEVEAGRVLLPAAVVQDTKIDFSQSEVMASDRGPLNLGPDSKDELIQQAQEEAEARIRVLGLERGILRSAEVEAEKLVKSLDSSNSLVVEFKRNIDPLPRLKRVGFRTQAGIAG